MLSNLNLIPDARSNALQNAANDAHLPSLPADYTFGCLEIYLGEQEEPALSLINGEIVGLNVPLNPAPILQMVGDDGFVYIAVDGKTELDRLQHCQLPQLKNDFLAQKITEIVGR